MKQQRFAPVGLLALNPKAFGQVFDLDEPEGAPNVDAFGQGVAVVTIRGPLMHRREFFFDSYEAIKERVAIALEDRPRAVILSIDSPGGLVAGAFDTSRELRAMALAAGVDLYAHVDGQATSAAYALASAASRIVVSASAMLGSIGVIDMMVDATAANQMMGLNVQLVTSGERKADGNPNEPINEGALAATQRRVDTLAEMFFGLVVEHGWSKSPEDLRGMQAAIVTGNEATKIGLATEVATLDQTIAFALSSEAKSKESGNTMATDKEDALASLRKMAESEDEEEAKAAKAALKALGEDDDEDAKSEDDDAPPEAEDDDEDAKSEDDDEDAKSEDDDEDAKAQDDDEDAKAQDDDEDASASAKALALAAKAMAKVHNFEAKQAKRSKRASRKKMLAARPDIAPDMIAVLSDPKMSDKQVSSLLENMDRGPARKDRVAAAATATGTRGDGQGSQGASRLPPEQKAALDAQMGLTQMSSETVNTPTRQSFGVRRAVTKGK